MYSVTQRIKAIKQPRSGYLPIKQFTRKELEDSYKLNPQENIHPAIVGLTVDYLSRLEMGETPREAFDISLMGAQVLGKFVPKLPIDLSDESIRIAVELSSYDVAVRATPLAYRPTDQPDAPTIENIRILTNRVINYYKDEPLVWSGFTFEGGYTDTVVAGDGDWLTKDTMWDLKVLRSEPNANHTLQLLMYWLMGIESIHKIYKDMKYLAILNPRKNISYKIKVSDIDPSIIEDVKRDVLVMDM